MRKQIANLTANIINPFTTGLVVIVLVSFETSDSVSSAIKWSLLLAALNLLPIFLFAVYLVRQRRLDSVFASARRQRTKIYVLGIALSGASSLILFLLRAPPMLLALSIAGFAAIVAFMGINLRWKISLHTAVITAAVTVALTLYGFMAAASIVLIPLVAWARTEMEHHSLAQVIGGGILATLILLIVFRLFGLV